MILGGYVHSIVFLDADGIIAPYMAKFELEGLSPQDMLDELVTLSNTNLSIL